MLPSGCAASPSQGHLQYSFSSGFSDNCRQKKNSTEFLLKPLDLKSDFTLTLGYLNPSLTPPPPQVYKGTVRVKCFTKIHNTMTQPVSNPELSIKCPPHQQSGHSISH